MESLKALERLLDIIDIHFENDMQKEIDICTNTIKQDIERLEVLEKAYLEQSEAYDTLYETNELRYEENEKLKKENHELKQANNELVNESTYYQVLKDKYEEESAIFYEKNVKIKNIFMQFSKWLNDEIDEKDKILKSKKGTYTHIVELSTLIFVLDKLKEVLG